tara:strand:- start:296 stop:484 length:189 start_codon:yes stop_codon:yes gene_type:complete
MQVGDLVRKTFTFPKEAGDMLGIVVKLELGDWDAIYAKVYWGDTCSAFWSKENVLEVINASR